VGVVGGEGELELEEDWDWEDIMKSMSDKSNAISNSPP